VLGSLQKNAKVVTIDSYEDVAPNSEKSLQKAVANQPVSVAIEAAGRAFQLYDSVSATNPCCCWNPCVEHLWLNYSYKITR
jgi:hypothetical protein